MNEMNENQQTKIENQRIAQREDEIELIDILRVIWKWKNLIVLGTIFCGVLAALISLNMKKIYSVDMVLRPGILSIEKGGRNVHIDSPQNIKALIESGMFNNNIVNYSKGDNHDNISKELRFRVTIPKESDTIKVQLETSNIKQGVDFQNRLSELLLENYIKLVKYFKNEQEIKLNSIKSEIESVKKKIQSYKRNVKIIEKRIYGLISEIELIKNNTEILIKERDQLLSKKTKENAALSSLLYSNTIQQNLQLSNNYQNEINSNQIKKEGELQKIEELEEEIAQKLNEAVGLQFKIDNIQNIQILQPATSSPYPIKPKKKLIVMLTSSVGLFNMILLAFFLENLSKFKKRDDS